MKSIFTFFRTFLQAIEEGKRLRAETRTKHFRIV
jgi:hypothetical protein